MAPEPRRKPSRPGGPNQRAQRRSQQPPVPGLNSRLSEKGVLVPRSPERSVLAPFVAMPGAPNVANISNRASEKPPRICDVASSRRPMGWGVFHCEADEEGYGSKGELLGQGPAMTAFYPVSLLVQIAGIALNRLTSPLADSGTEGEPHTNPPFGHFV